jgi:hypothetical protein
MITSGHDPGGDNFDWKTAVLDTETGLISTNNGSFTKGNVAYDIDRMVKRVRDDPSRYEKFQNIRTVLQFFVLKQFLCGSFTALNQEEAPLVEASVGRLKRVGEKMVTILDEPFVLRAAVNYFLKFDPDFTSSLKLYFSLPRNASDLGHSWENTILPSLVFSFHDKVLSESALIPPRLAPVFAFNNENPSDAVLVPRSSQVSADASDNMNMSDADDMDLDDAEPGSPTVGSDQDKLGKIDEVLTRRTRIVGLDQHMYGISHDRVSLGEFLEAHVQNGSRLRDGTQVPAFYFPVERTTGPDIVFVLHFEDKGFVPVFIQTKLCLSLNDDKIQHAFRTVMAHAVQGHLNGTKLETFCTASPKLFLGVVVSYPFTLPADFESRLSRRRTRSQDAGVERDLWGMLLKIDADNIRSVFPENHVKALDAVKGLAQDMEGVISGPLI